MKSPKYPSPQQQYGAQTQADLSSAMAQTYLNQVNQNTPYGSLSYSKTGEASYHDPLLNKDIKIPQFTQTTTLSPEQQALLKQEQAFDKQYNDIALQQTGRIGNLLATPWSYSPGAHEKWAGGIYDTLNADANRKALASADTTLANKGLAAGSEAYNDAMRNTIEAQNRDRTAFMLDTYNTGMNQSLTERNQPINEIGALMSGGQITQPTFSATPSVSMQSPDYAGMMQAQYANKAANQGGTLGALAGLGGAALGGWASSGFKFSDARLKSNIKPVGKMFDGTNIYSYKIGGLSELGVMAQEIEETHPEAVAEMPGGWLGVDYDQLSSEVF